MRTALFPIHSKTYLSFLVLQNGSLSADLISPLHLVHNHIRSFLCLSNIMQSTPNQNRGTPLWNFVGGFDPQMCVAFLSASCTEPVLKLELFAGERCRSFSSLFVMFAGLMLWICIRFGRERWPVMTATPHAIAIQLSSVPQYIYQYSHS